MAAGLAASATMYLTGKCTCDLWFLATLRLKDWPMVALELAAPTASICLQTMTTISKKSPR